MLCCKYLGVLRFHYYYYSSFMVDKFNLFSMLFNYTHLQVFVIIKQFFLR